MSIGKALIFGAFGIFYTYFFSIILLTIILSHRTVYIVCLTSAHYWGTNPIPGSGDSNNNNFDKNCPLGNYDPADNQTVCSVTLPSINYVKDFANAAELLRYNCLQPDARRF